MNICLINGVIGGICREKSNFVRIKSGIVMNDIFNYVPRHTTPMQVKSLTIGGDAPICFQTMTTCATTDIAACVAQCERIVKTGAQLIRLTTQGAREVEALAEIKDQLRTKGISVPLVADVHFNPNVADLAAAVADKVRINPGNYIDPARTFKTIEYSDEEYADELARLEARFKVLLNLCKQHGTALRIGVNHGSLSDRIMTRYGDTPAGIVESCMEFLRVCVKESFYDVVVSIKASNTVIMVQTVRLLCEEMKKEGMTFPLHLGVTEAGEGEDGRIKSAAGIGALLADGIGDTIRVSLSEEPEAELPVAYKIAAYACARAGHQMIPGKVAPDFNYIYPVRRKTHAVGRIGGDNLPVLLTAARPTMLSSYKKWRPDYIYCGKVVPAVSIRKKGVGYIVDADVWREDMEDVFPAFNPTMLPFFGQCKASVKFMFATFLSLNDELKAALRVHRDIVLVVQSNHANRLGEQRAFIHELWREGFTHPVVVMQHYAKSANELEDFQIEAAVDTGGLFFDAIADGLFLFNDTPKGKAPLSGEAVAQTGFGILQAVRARMTRTEYISCPGCGRTLFDLQGTIARVKAATAQFKGLKIGVMGCIVNGPGEMADADYGYVGAARGKISLYRNKECVEKNIPEEEAVDRLLALIETDLKRK